VTETPLPASGWYPDPSGSTGLRWWDGERWTDDTHDLPDEDLTRASASTVGRRRGRVIAVVAALLVMVLLAAAVVSVGLGRTRLTTLDVEAQIATAIANELGVPTTVTCPDVVDAGTGLTFTCDVNIDDGTRATVKVTQNDDAGSVTWDIVSAT
jgi:hypothetical protein